MTQPIAEARPHWLARLFGASCSIRVFFNRIEVANEKGTTIVPADAAQRLTALRGLLGRQFVIEDTNHITHRIWGLPGRAAGVAEWTLAELRRLRLLRSLLDRFEDQSHTGRYISRSEFAAWIRLAQEALNSLSMPPLALDKSGVTAQLIDSVKRVVEAGESARCRRNDMFVREEKRRYAHFFSTLLSYPLTDSQIEAILHDEDRSLVLAGAGTGKTSTIVAKICYLLHARLARPEEILVLAFTRKARDEVAGRVRDLLGTKTRIETFHSLGLDILAHADNSKPSVTRLAEDENKLLRWITTWLDDQIARGESDDPAIEFLAYRLFPYRARDAFENEHAYIQYLNGHRVVTLRQERVKSLEECEIADWLTLHGIEYEYERPYPEHTASIRFRQYKPDFYLPKYDIYIEHFGINRDGNPPAHFRDPDRYKSAIEWKRRLHSDNDTILIETFSWEKRDGCLTANLQAKLRQCGVPIRRIGPRELHSLLTHKHRIDPVARLIGRFLSVFKANRWTIERVTSASVATSSADHERTRVFLRLFSMLLSAYDAALATRGEIDFDDMIVQSTDRVNDHKYRSGFKYILVDEFQDITTGRAALLLALSFQVPSSRLFCVGDDWQSIYRFTGSDVSLVTEFDTHFGYARRTDLDLTHRLSDASLAVSSQFITRNPTQLNKELRAASRTNTPAIVILSGGVGEEERQRVFEEALLRIAASAGGEQATVLVMGRYNRSCKTLSREADQQMTNLEIEYDTVHKVKGREADYAVIVDVTGGVSGFPSQVEDDPLLELLLPNESGFPHAEERRLFYVALTRARRQTFVLTSDAQRSVFIEELEGEGYAGLVSPPASVGRLLKCAICEGGRMVSRSSEHGEFLGCSNYPLCESKAIKCPSCDRQTFVRQQKKYVCGGDECDYEAPICPQCGLGAIIRVEGPYGPFKGCTEWRSCRGVLRF